MASPAKQGTGFCKTCDAQRLLVKGGGHGIPAGAGNTIMTIATGGAWLLPLALKRKAEPANEWRCSQCGTPTAPDGSAQAKIEGWNARMQEKIVCTEERSSEPAKADWRSEVDHKRSEVDRKRSEDLERKIEHHRAEAIVDGVQADGERMQWTELRPSRRFAKGHARAAMLYEQELAKLRAKHPEWTSAAGGASAAE